MVASWRVAASVIIISRTTGRLLMMQRGPTAKFMPNAFVFPGGVLSPTDEQMGLATKICALREAFEETGLRITEKGVESAADNQELAALQDEVNKDAGAFEKVLEKTAISQLIDWSSWLTPTSYPKRFMTSFYLLPVDGEPEIRMCEREMAGHGWQTPAELLEKAVGGGLPPPQTYEVTRLAQTPVGEWAMHCNMKTMAPQPISWDDGVHLTISLPGDHLYIEEDAEHVKIRKMTAKEIAPNPHKPTHRVDYEKEMWARPSIYQHHLKEPYHSIFMPLKTSSQALLAKEKK